jgi:hypothetical protein
MFIFMYLPYDIRLQKGLHRNFRKKIQEWQKLGLVSRAVLKCTTDYPNPDYLQVCLDIPSMGESTEPAVILPEQTKEQIPHVITKYFEDVCQRYNIKGDLRDFRAVVEQAKKKTEQRGGVYYGGANVDDVLNFSSLGSQIAFEILDRLEENPSAYTSDATLGDFIYRRLGNEMKGKEEWIDEAFHFVCVSLGIDNRNEHHVMLFHDGDVALEDVRLMIRSGLSNEV